MDLNVHGDLDPWNDDWERGMQPDIDLHNMGEVMHVVDPNWEMRWEGGDRPLQDHIGDEDDEDDLASADAAIHRDDQSDGAPSDYESDLED